MEIHNGLSARGYTMRPGATQWYPVSGGYTLYSQQGLHNGTQSAGASSNGWAARSLLVALPGCLVASGRAASRRTLCPRQRLPCTRRSSGRWSLPRGPPRPRGRAPVTCSCCPWQVKRWLRRTDHAWSQPSIGLIVELLSTQWMQFSKGPAIPIHSLQFC
jgi:hypothetical protein